MTTRYRRDVNTPHSDTEGSSSLLLDRLLATANLPPTVTRVSGVPLIYQLIGRHAELLLNTDTRHMVVRMLTAAAGYHDDSYHDNSVEMMKDVITLFTVSYTHTHSHTHTDLVQLTPVN